MKFLAAYILKGRQEAVLAASTLAILSLLLPPLSLVSSAIVALVTLRLGAKEGLTTLIICSGITLALEFAIKIEFPVTLYFIGFIWLPVLAISFVLREIRHLGLALEAGVVYTVIAVLCFYALIDDPAGFWKDLLTKLIPKNLPIENLDQVIAENASGMTGVTSTTLLLFSILGLLLGRWWQSLLFNPGGFRLEFLSLKIQPSISIVFFAMLGLGMMDFGMLSEIAMIVSKLMLVLFTLSGISVSHSMLSGMPNVNFTIPLFYITLLTMRNLTSLVALVGIVDTWLDIRKRYKKK